MGAPSPARDAKSIRLRGKVIVKIGTASKEEEQHDVPLRAGSVISLGGEKAWEIFSVEPSDRGDKKAYPLIATVRKLETCPIVKRGSLVFSDANGEKLRVAGAGTTTHIDEKTGKVSYLPIWLFPKKLESVNIRCEFWTEFKEYELPVDLDLPIERK